ncbi:hypothetical protein CON65_23655 [Bacillus pseudomycoides]|uniref:Uncharacterized protein n=1 Tax=Bacillus pseudomycoides TaxID=64104 RepID=A0AA91ZS37_9BACI|nr:hypothetical protein COO03_25415 [Bacillus sp. AFS098217]PED80273.1 hypothetical protein CON65_23655 [Bacillus pseudomycoides]PEU17670.1 hypothetical protein CN524_01185 [Bacillus sp. AFS019443]PEU17921.1 hypothetical protein CN525_13675 [Bacillus sp. AFS014408]PFW62595.1 hypothetical protein COL20_12395 [Bacillus sp. AFS075034]
MYKLNTEGKKNPLTTPSGKTITINKNYLHYNPIHSEKGKIEDYWIEDDSVLNILVPASLQKYEDEIEANFLKHESNTIPYNKRDPRGLFCLS